MPQENHTIMSTSMSGAASLEAEMEICQDAARKAIARADAISPILDEFGHARSAAHADALRYMKMSARLGLSLAMLKGEQTLRIHKTETIKPPPSVERPPGRLAPPPSPDRFHAAWQKFTRETFGWEWGDDGNDEATGQGDPPALSGGSNTPAP